MISGTDIRHDCKIGNSGTGIPDKRKPDTPSSVKPPGGYIKIIQKQKTVPEMKLKEAAEVNAVGAAERYPGFQLMMILKDDPAAYCQTVFIVGK